MQMAKSFDNLPGRRTLSDDRLDFERSESHWEPKTNWGGQLHGRRVMNIEDQSQKRSPGRDMGHSTWAEEINTPTAMCVSDVVAAFESGELDMDRTASIKPASFCPVCLNYNHKMWPYQQVKNISCFIRNRCRDVLFWRNRQTGASNKQHCHQQQYQQGRNRHSGWCSYDWYPWSTQTPTPSTSASKDRNMSGTNCDKRLDVQPTNRTYKSRSCAACSGRPPSNRSDWN